MMRYVKHLCDYTVQGENCWSSSGECRVKPELFEKLALLMKQHNCTSQARLIELLVEDGAKSPESRKERGKRSTVTDKGSKSKNKLPRRKRRGNLLEGIKTAEWQPVHRR